MAGSYRPVSRDQQFLLPVDMGEWLPDDHLAWFLIDVVAELDTSAFHADRVLGGRGRAAYDPDMMLALLLYAYANKVHASRSIERLCDSDVAFRVICGSDGPDHATIARFRAVHDQGFKALFASVLGLCRAHGMVRVGVVSIDGTKVLANASRGANRSEQWLLEQASKIVDEATAVDAQQDAEFGDAVGDELPAQLAGRSGRGARIRAALAEVDRQKQKAAADDDADAQRARDYLARVQAGQLVGGRAPAGTDPVALAQARLANAQAKHAASAPCSNARADASKAIKKHTQKLAEAKAAQEAGTVQVRPGRAARRRARNGTWIPHANLTDPDSRLMTAANGGSVQAYNVQLAVSDDHVIIACQAHQSASDQGSFEPMLTAAVHAAQALHGHDRHADRERDAAGGPAGIGVVLADAGYLSEHNLTVDGPPRLIATGKHRDLHKTPPGQPPPASDDRPISQMRQRLADPAVREQYKRRGATVEPVNAHLKHGVGLQRFSRRGLSAVTSELNLAATVVNLQRLHNRTRAAT